MMGNLRGMHPNSRKGKRYWTADKVHPMWQLRHEGVTLQVIADQFGLYSREHARKLLLRHAREIDVRR